MNRRALLSGFVATAGGLLLPEPRARRKPYPPLVPTAWRVDYESSGSSFCLFLTDGSRARYFAKHVKNGGLPGTVRLVEVSAGLAKVLRKYARAEEAWYERFRNAVELRAAS